MAPDVQSPQTMEDWRRLLQEQRLLETWESNHVVVAAGRTEGGARPTDEAVIGFARYLGLPVNWHWDSDALVWRAQFDLSQAKPGMISPAGPKPPAGKAEPGAGSAAPQPVVLRASSNVWSQEEAEGFWAPGTERPFVVFDEETVHLAATTRRLTTDDLLQRTRSFIAAQGVPVDVEAREVRWISDSGESRPRVVASLSNHRFSDIKAVMGVDYVGDWANLQFQMAYQPPPNPAPPAPPAMPQLDQPTNMAWAITLLGGGLGVCMMFAADVSMKILGLVVVGGAIIGGVVANSAFKTAQAKYLEARAGHSRKMQEGQAAYQRQLAARERAATSAFAVRTFKIDDMRLFSTAMRAVFQAVVDDVLQMGGNVVRVEGGNGGFFGHAAPTTEAKADAAQVAV